MRAKSDKRGAPKGRPGMPPAKIDLVELEKLCGLNCTIQEIAAWFGLNEKTIDRYAKKPRFREAMERGRAKGRVSVRREQFALLQAGNATMGIWLGKQLLGQRDYDRERRIFAPPDNGPQKAVIPEWLLQDLHNHQSPATQPGSTSPSPPSDDSTATSTPDSRECPDPSAAENQRPSAMKPSSWPN